MASSSATATREKKSLKSLNESDLRGKRVLVRLDLDVPLEGLNITDDTKIKAAIPTIKYLIQHGAKTILVSHLGRPRGCTPKFSLEHLLPRLRQLLQVQVRITNDCIGPNVEKLVGYLPEGGVLLLENVRYYKEEKKNDYVFARKLASLADLFVNDAFVIADKAHASTYGVASFLTPSVAGFLMQKELQYLDKAMNNQKKPFVAFIGGSILSTKSNIINSLLDVVTHLILGGRMIFTFYCAQGRLVDLSLVETNQIELAISLMKKAHEKKVKITLPSDILMLNEITSDHAVWRVDDSSIIEPSHIALDIGPETKTSYVEHLDSAKAVVWNGPVGMYDLFMDGTKAIVKKLVDIQDKDVVTIIIGNDSIEAVEEFGLTNKLSRSHFSTGGDVSLKLLGGESLPAINALDDV